MKKVVAIPICAAAAAICGTIFCAASTVAAAAPNPKAGMITISQNSHTRAPMLTGASARASASKTATAMSWFHGVQHSWALAGRTHTGHTGLQDSSPCPCPSAPDHLRLGVTYWIQQTENWCGPTSIDTIADYLSVVSMGDGAGVQDGWSKTDGAYHQQSQAAKLAIDPSVQGTDWQGPDGVPLGSWSSKYPMQDVLNFLVRQKSPNFYDITALPDAPSTNQVNQFEGNLVFDINNGNGWPMAANEYAAPGYYLPDQNSSGIIEHWLAPTGYANQGGSTVYEDPGWGNGSAETVGTTRYVNAIGGRGYVY